MVNKKKKKAEESPLKIEGSASFKMIWDDLIVPLSFRQHIQRSIMRRISERLYPLDYGFIIFGPPGTGKTSITKGIAKQLGWDYVYLSPQTFVLPDTPIDEAAKRRFNEISELIKKKAKQKRKATWDKKESDGHAPVNLVFVFDEIDELVVTRNDVVDRQSRFSTTMMLPLIQKLREEAEKFGFIFFVLTNHIERFDSAIIRKGRFDLILPLGPPDTQGRFLLFRIFVDELRVEYKKKFDIEIRTEYDEEGENGDIFLVKTTDFDIVSRASARLSLEDIDAVCRKVVEHEKIIQPSLKEKSEPEQDKFLYLHTDTFIDFIHKFRLSADQNQEIEKFYTDVELYSRGSTIYPKENTLQEKIEHEFSSLHINHNLSLLGSKWVKNKSRWIIFSFTNVSISHSLFVGQINVVAVMNGKIIKTILGAKDEPVAAGVTSDYYFEEIKPRKKGKLKIIFTVEGKFYPRGIEEVVEKGSVELGGKLVHVREVLVV